MFQSVTNPLIFNLRQVYEMFLAGYQFQVLSPLFTCHWGMQNGKNPAWRERQNSANRKHFDVFKREVFARYQKDPLKMIRSSNSAAAETAKRLAAAAHAVKAIDAGMIPKLWINWSWKMSEFIYCLYDYCWNEKGSEF